MVHVGGRVVGVDGVRLTDVQRATGELGVAEVVLRLLEQCPIVPPEARIDRDVGVERLGDRVERVDRRDAA